MGTTGGSAGAWGRSRLSGTDRAADGLRQPHALHGRSCPARTLADACGHPRVASLPPCALAASPEFNKVVRQLSPGDGMGQQGDRQLPEQRRLGVQSMQTGLLPGGPGSPPIAGLSKYKTPEGGGGYPGEPGDGGGRVVSAPQPQPPPRTPLGEPALWPHPRKTHMHSKVARPGPGRLAVPSEARGVRP